MQAVFRGLGVKWAAPCSQEFLAESEETWNKNCDSLLIGAAPQHAVFCETKALERIIRALLIACMLEIPQSSYPIVSVIFPFFFSKPGTI